MGTEYLVWKYRPALSVTVLFFVVCNVHLTSTDNNVAPVGKLYPRRNHWAVGHLMGKKDSGSVESERVSYPRLQSPAEEEYLDRYLQPSNLVRHLTRLPTRQERQNEAAQQGNRFSTGRVSGRKDRQDGTMPEATDFLLQALGIEDRNSAEYRGPIRNIRH